MTSALASSWLRHSARMSRLNGSVIHAPLRRTFVGERCDVLIHPNRPDSRLCQAQTIGFTEQDAILSLLGDTQGIPRDAWVVPSGQGPHVALDGGTLGAVLDGEGRTVARLAAAPQFPGPATALDIDATPPELTHRRGVDTIFETGVRAIDGLLTCGVGQRIGIFAGAGGGKTSLISMLIAHARADVYVVGLVGERGREASEFIQHGIPQDKRARTVLVCSTSDRPPAERRNAAHMATSIAEHYRATGKRVLLVIDSVTRYARALRDLALSAGEAPARRGYPASVFEALPRLLERPGAVEGGSITAFYTILLEDEEQAEPIGEEVRSILDGHIYLSRKLAERAHYPAIDVLKSASRVMQSLAGPTHLAAAVGVRNKLSRLADLQLALDLGEYKQGEDADVDALLHIRPSLDRWLTQPMTQAAELADTLETLNAFA
ncbi:SctN family type III secretion system ATPase InvC [Achromobacter xylosoxidans]